MTTKRPFEVTTKCRAEGHLHSGMDFFGNYSTEERAVAKVLAELRAEGSHYLPGKMHIRGPSVDRWFQRLEHGVVAELVDGTWLAVDL